MSTTKIKNKILFHSKTALQQGGFLYTDIMTTYDELVQIVDYLDKRFPDGCEIFQRVSRLAEETGELAQAVNHMEGMGIKHEKYGTPDHDKLAKEIQDVLRAAMGIAKYYDLESRVEQSIHDDYARYMQKV